MPTYELCLVLRALPRPKLSEAILRASEKVLESGGVVRAVESLGERTLPQLQTAHDETHSRGVYFQVMCDLPRGAVRDLLDEYRRDSDILRKAFVALDQYADRPDPVCTMGEELRSPTTRPSVMKMMEEGRRPHRFKRYWTPRSGLDYYPFHR